MCFRSGLRTVGYDIDDITDLVLLEVGRERDLRGIRINCVCDSLFELSHHSLLLEVPREAARCQSPSHPYSSAATHA
jgi:hypothetical protein